MRRVIKCIIVVGLIIAVLVLLINFYVIISTKKQVFNKADIKDVDCILILGCGVWGDKPSPMLEDRLLGGIELYKQGVSKKIIVSGDHGTKEYDEVNIMKKYLIDNDIPGEDIFMDHAGFSTYDSVYRAKEIFGAKKVVIVTQKYHLYRALYIANELNIESIGVYANPRLYAGQSFREVREILARNKDFIKAKIKPKSTYLGEKIDLNIDGNITND